MKNNYIYLLILVLIYSCNSLSEPSEVKGPTITKYQPTPIFQILLDSHRLTGTIVIYDENEQTYYSNDFKRAKKGFLPASTFKIPNSLIGLQTGAIQTNTIFKWDGQERFLKSWEKDMNLHQAYHASCVPCYQELARSIGLDSMRHYLEALSFGQMEVDSSNLDQFWLRGDSRISAIQQIEFLQALNQNQLPLISDATFSMMKKIMVLDEKEDYILRGKTGWSTDGNQNLGWFVGIENNSGKTYYIASNVEPSSSFDMDDFSRVRLKISREALSKMESLNKL